MSIRSVAVLPYAFVRNLFLTRKLQRLEDELQSARETAKLKYFALLGMLVQCWAAQEIFLDAAIWQMHKHVRSKERFPRQFSKKIDVFVALHNAIPELVGYRRLAQDIGHELREVGRLRNKLVHGFGMNVASATIDIKTHIFTKDRSAPIYSVVESMDDLEISVLVDRLVEVGEKFIIHANLIQSALGSKSM